MDDYVSKRNWNIILNILVDFTISFGQPENFFEFKKYIFYMLYVTKFYVN